MREREFHYRFPGYAHAQRPGHHRGTVFGSGLEFRGYAPLLRAPDPRRIDIRATIADPLENWQVRLYQQRASIAVYLVADLSASMRLATKLEVLGQFAAALAYSVHRTGDSLGVVGCDEHIIPELLLPSTHSRAAGAELAARLAGFEPSGRSAAALLQAVDFLGRRPALVFLASDFHFPISLLDRVLETLAAHFVVPLVLWDELRTDGEFRALPPIGLTQLQDAESGRRRLLFVRPSLRAAWRHRFAERRASLIQCFARHARRPFFVGREFRPEAMTAYFFGTDHGEPTSREAAVHG
jgi:uncharacterized protein (DUF58 family)